MVDVSDKAVTVRIALAEGRVRMSETARHVLFTGSGPKGDVLAAARIAAVMASKRTADLIPLCHSLPLSGVQVRFGEEPDGVRIEVECKTVAKTGVEMEALTAVSVAALTVYDMLKAVDRGMRIDGVRVLRKEGGRSGVYEAPPGP